MDIRWIQSRREMSFWRTIIGLFRYRIDFVENDRTDRYIYLDNHWMFITINHQNDRCRFGLTEIISLNLINKKTKQNLI